MEMTNIANEFRTRGIPVQCEPFGHGHINSTYKITTDQGVSYILQRINKHVFKDPVAVVSNANAVTSFIRSKGQIALQFIPDKSGAFCYQDDAGEYWRMYEFVEGFCMDAPQCAEDFYQSALAFGKFQDLLSDFPAQTLVETIPNFHNTVDRYRQLKQSIAADPKGRLCAAQAEADFYLEQEALGSRLQEMRQAEQLPLRVTHNDTKYNNVLLSSDSHLPLCVLDLDTVMPGLSLYDFGDAIRSGANTAAEDEKDTSKVSMDLELFAVYVRGYLEAAPSLTDAEVSAFPLAAFTMTLECGCRFLKDYLDGDIYFRTAYPEHNLVRCRSHMALVSDMLDKWDEMVRIVDTIRKEVRG